MTITFECRTNGCSPGNWSGTIRLLKTGDPCEAEVAAQGNRFHLITGKHAYGNYVCIPDWNIGTELSSLTDTFWNTERLQNYSGLKKAEICTVVAALNAIADYVN